MVSLQGGKSSLNIRGSNPTWEVANKCLNAIELVEVVEKNKDGPLPSPKVPLLVNDWQWRKLISCSRAWSFFLNLV